MMDRIVRCQEIEVFSGPWPKDLDDEFSLRGLPALTDGRAC